MKRQQKQIRDYLPFSSRAGLPGKAFFLALLLMGASLFPLVVGASIIDDLNSQIDERRRSVQDHDDKIKKFEEDIDAKQQQAASIENQVEILSKNIDKTQAEIDSNNKKIELTQTEIEKTNLEIKLREEEIIQQKKILLAFIVELSKRDEENPIEIWLKNNSFSDFLDQSQYIENLQKKGQETLDDIEKLKDDLDWKKQTLKADEDQLEDFKKELKGKQVTLETQKGEKEEFLDQTKSDEKSYQDLLKQAKEEQDQVNREIANIEQQIRNEANQNSGNGGSSLVNPNKDAIFSWPVSPLRGISTRFCDPTYPFKYLYPDGCHPGIDVPAPQGSALRAAANGVVRYRKFTGTSSYQYMILQHDGGWTTVYGHMTSFSVGVGDYVRSGDVIGTTGGARGSVGSGVSSGPHLHFESRRNGLAVDPVRVLP